MKAIYPGSFDPITFGHADIIQRIQPLFDEVIVLVANATSKDYLFSPEERKTLIENVLDSHDNVKVDIFSGLTVEYAKQMNAKVMVRGLRLIADFEHEMAMANVNKNLNSEVETLIVFASPEYNYVSSRLAKEVANFGGDLNKLVPEAVAEALKSKFTK